MLAEGKSSVSFDVQFRPLVSADDQTRTAGDAIKHFHILFCFFPFKKPHYVANYAILL